ncbi:MAG: choline BCCT transporter BetT [Gammaproteobacteria bacterium]|nr:choline BCCT transporter BetT [Gammaproteobacteria bacterium]
MDTDTSTQTGRTISPPVFYTSAILITILVGFASIFPDVSQDFFSQVQAWIVENVSWFYILTLALILIATVFMAASRYGDIKLGPDHSEPDYKNASWFAMLFSAGMGIGLMFFGVAEPVMHFIAPPVGEPNTIEAAREAMKLTFFHWGLHAWAVYAVVALILAFFSYRHGLPLTLRSALYPLIGDRIYGPIGHAVDIFAIISTVLGIATSLGYGVLQINSGFNYLFGLPIGTNVQVILIISITALATLSVVTGLDKGVKRLSELNLILAVILLTLVLILGPTALLLKSFVENTGGYLSEIVSKTFNLYAYDPTDWLGGWTLLYWGWWISWSPFVGMFIARVSRGRTIREFIVGILLVPSGFTFLWMTAFGNTSIYMIMKQGITSLADTVSADTSLALFAFLEHFPFSTVLSMVAVCMVILFFVTSADSGSLVIDMLASGGKTETPIWQRIFWASSTGFVAIALLIGGGLAALQTATIASALPFSAILLVSIWGLLKALDTDSTKRILRQQSATHHPRLQHSAGGWQRRLRSMVMFPRRSHVNRFMDEVVVPAFEEVAEELRKQGYTAEVEEREDKRCKLEVQHNVEANFVYEVRARAYIRPDHMSQDSSEEDAEEREERKYFRAEVHLMEGGQDYDIMGWSRGEVIEDILDQYEQHMHFLHVVR